MKIELLSFFTGTDSSDASLLELYEKDVLTESTILHIYGGYRVLTSMLKAVAAGLSELRDVVARAEDESTGFILPNKTLLGIVI